MPGHRPAVSPLSQSVTAVVSVKVRLRWASTSSDCRLNTPAGKPGHGLGAIWPLSTSSRLRDHGIEQAGHVVAGGRGPGRAVGPLGGGGAVVGLGLAGVRHLDQLQVFVANLQVAAPRHAVGQKGGVGPAQHFAAGVYLLHPHAEPQLNVGPHLVGNAFGPLRGQNQVDALRPAHPGDAFQLHARYSGLSSIISAYSSMMMNRCG
jgi:hypothetical protein